MKMNGVEVSAGAKWIIAGAPLNMSNETVQRLLIGAAVTYRPMHKNRCTFFICSVPSEYVPHHVTTHVFECTGKKPFCTV
jgi:hypothetical protein